MMAKKDFDEVDLRLFNYSEFIRTPALIKSIAIAGL